MKIFANSTFIIQNSTFSEQSEEEMAYFNDAQQLYDVLGNFMKNLKDDPAIGPRVLETGLVIKFFYKNPDAVITVHCPKNDVIFGDIEEKADVEMTMPADVAHRFWLGKVNLMVALTKGEIKAKGPIPKILKLLPVIRSAYDMYHAYLEGKNLENLIVQ